MKKSSLVFLVLSTVLSSQSYGYGIKVLRNVQVSSVDCNYQQMPMPDHPNMSQLVNNSKLKVKGELISITGGVENDRGPFELSLAMPTLLITRGVYGSGSMDVQDLGIIRQLLVRNNINPAEADGATPITYRDLTPQFAANVRLRLQECQELKAAQASGQPLAKEIVVANLLLGTNSLDKLSPFFDGFAGESVGPGPAVCYSILNHKGSRSFTAAGVPVESCESFLGMK